MSATKATDAHHKILIIGGGAAGMTTAAMLRRKTRTPIAIVEPSETHAYQPGWTLVGSGVFQLPQTRRPTASVVPPDVTWIRGAVAEFEPEKNAVVLGDGSRLTYDWLVVCPGLTLAWDRVEGLENTLGRNGVCSNYRGELAAYTWEQISGFKSGRMLFTQPPMPIKCPGAPQKIAYLAADHLRRKAAREKAEIEFCTALPSLFAVAPFVPPLKEAMKRHGIAVSYNTNLTAIDGPGKRAIFTVTDADGATRTETRRFDLIHVTPPQRAPDCLIGSLIADAAGFVEVDQGTMQHVRYENIFGLGDGCSTPNSKTMAAVRMQAPIVVRNVLAAMKGTKPELIYDGYASCPLTTDYNRIVLAEFKYGTKVTPSFPVDPRVPRYLAWLLKSKFLPFLYWQIMLRGINLDIGHREREFADAA